MDAVTPWKDEAGGMTQSEFTMPQGISRIDECKDWANKAEATASYARQAEDDTLGRTADRIQGAGD